MGVWHLDGMVGLQHRQEVVAIGPNLQYGIRNEWVSSGEKVIGLEDSHWLYLNVFAHWRFSHLRQAMAKVVGQLLRTLLMYSDVVRSNVEDW